MEKTQKEIVEEKLEKVAGGSLDDFRVNSLADSMQKFIDILANQPLLSQLDCCDEAKTYLEQAKDHLINYRIENAYICTQDARLKIEAGISSTPEHAFALENVLERFYPIIRTLGELLDSI